MPILPPRLTPAATIGVFFPSIPVAAERVDRAASFLRERGFRVKLGSLYGKKDGYRSGSARERAAELNALLHDGEVDCLMAVSGGYVSNAMLPYLDYEYLKAHPKVIVGFSDVTALLLGIYAQTNLVTFYGPVLGLFQQKSPVPEETLRFFAELMEARPPYTLPQPEHWTDESIDHGERHAYHWQKSELVTLRGGAAEGRLIGGNGNTMGGILGSPYMPAILPGDILYLEDKRKCAEELERSFAHMKLCGVFGNIGGLILGKHIDYDDRGTGRKPWDILREVLGGEPEFPVLGEFDCSHATPMLTLPLGVRARLDADAQTLTVLDPWVE